MNLSALAGVDEAGRGPIAGPVVAAAVILPDDFPLSGLRDSKRLSPKERNYFYALIKSKALAVESQMIHSQEIDQINILKASLKAMFLAIQTLPTMPKKILVDGINLIPDIQIPQEAIIKGDAKHPSIMSASIIAKVTRDRWMENIDRRYPQYGFRFHKGYGTPFHLQALKRHGPCPIHRKSFAPVKDNTPPDSL